MIADNTYLLLLVHWHVQGWQKFSVEQANQAVSPQQVGGPSSVTNPASKDALLPALKRVVAL